jgi:bacterioferritin
MKTQKKLLAILNSLLAEELTAINQNTVHSEMYENWGYSKLNMAIRKQAMDGMHHVVWLIERIVFYNGAPLVYRLNTMKIGKTVSEMINNNNDGKHEVVSAYHEAIRFASDLDDQGTVDMLSKILKVEEVHLDWAANQHKQIGQIGMENYLANQTEYLLN